MNIWHSQVCPQRDMTEINPTLCSKRWESPPIDKTIEDYIWVVDFASVVHLQHLRKHFSFSLVLFPHRAVCLSVPVASLKGLLHTETCSVLLVSSLSLPPQLLQGLGEFSKGENEKYIFCFFSKFLILSDLSLCTEIAGIMACRDQQVQPQRAAPST